MKTFKFKSGDECKEKLTGAKILIIRPRWNIFSKLVRYKVRVCFKSGAGKALGFSEEYFTGSCYEVELIK